MKDIILLAESLESIVRLSDEDAGSLLKALATGDEENLSAIASIVYPLIKGQVDRMADLREKRSAAGKLGGSKTKQTESKTEAKPKQSEAPVPVPVPVPVPNQNLNQREGRFAPPTLEEVRDYVHETGLQMDPDAFFDHFKSNGWKVGGKAAMKDWRATARNWARREKTFHPENKKDERRIDYDAAIRDLYIREVTG